MVTLQVLYELNNLRLVNLYKQMNKYDYRIISILNNSGLEAATI